MHITVEESVIPIGSTDYLCVTAYAHHAHMSAKIYVDRNGHLYTTGKENSERLA